MKEGKLVYNVTKGAANGLGIHVLCCLVQHSTARRVLRKQLTTVQNAVCIDLHSTVALSSVQHMANCCSAP
jgi:hypothetical protein